jgi:hypothetical protein
MFHVRGTLCWLFCALLSLGSLSISTRISKAEVIYENLTTPQSAFVSEMREHGDQIDLGGTARRLTQILFYYYADFVPTGDEVVKVRLYNNLIPYDDFRKSPTTLLYESDWISITPGTATRQIDDLNILLPLDNVTFTVEFEGLLATEQAGLLFYDPPTEGYSFNEFWIRSGSGVWRTINYPSSPGLRANLAIRLVATNDVVLDQQQTTVTAALPLRTPDTQVRYAQTFTPSISGLLSHINLDLNFATTPVRLRILDTIDGHPGPYVLGSRNIIRATTIDQPINMTALSIFLEKDKQYAIEVSTAVESSLLPSYLLAAGPNNYSRGALWSRSESAGSWTKASPLPADSSEVDAAFQVHMVAAQPFTRLLTPSPNQSFDLSEPIVFRAQVRKPDISTMTRVRFMEGTNQLAAVTNAPYEFVWTNPIPGEHKIRAIADDSFKRPFRSDILTVFVRQPGPPENDNFGSRLALDGLNLRRVKPSVGATTEPGEPGLRPSHAGATLWWSWTAYDSSPVTLTTATGASISVFTGSSVNALTLVASALSSLRFDPQPGVTYSISIDPSNDNDQVVLDLTTGLRFVGTSIRNNLPTLTFESLNRTTWIEYSTDLRNWTRVASSSAPSTFPVTWSDTGPATNNKRFYRLVTQ